MAIVGHCPGPFRGAVPLPLPLGCDGVHIVLGILVGACPRWRGALILAFVAYQAVEELPSGDGVSFTKDVTLFGCGVALGYSLACA